MNDDATLPGGLEHLTDIVAVVGWRRPAFFLDFDGTLAPITSTPGSVTMSPDMRQVIAGLAAIHLVCIASGRGLKDLRAKVGLPSLYYAADHGHHILGPEGSGIELEIAPPDALELELASYELERRLRDIQGAMVETKGVSLSVHYRLVPEAARAEVERIMIEVAGDSPGLRLTAGKLVYELTPDLGWDKGRAMVWLLKRLGFRRSAVCPICLGDDRTDENLFGAAKHWGISLVVGEVQSHTLADYYLSGPGDVQTFLAWFGGQSVFRQVPGGRLL